MRSAGNQRWLRKEEGGEDEAGLSFPPPSSFVGLPLLWQRVFGSMLLAPWPPPPSLGLWLSGGERGGLGRTERERRGKRSIIRPWKGTEKRGPPPVREGKEGKRYKAVV